MPKLSDMFPSKWLSAADLPDDGVVVQIIGIDQERVGQGQDAEDKWILSFKGAKKGLVLNKVNTNIIAKLYGDDTDEWEGKLIHLYPTETEYQGKMVDCIRVRTKAPTPKAKAGAAKTPAPAPAPEPQEAEEGDEGEAPF